VSETIAKRIAKLLRLAESPHQAEAEAAILKAHELATAHGLEVERCRDSDIATSLDTDITEVVEQKRYTTRLHRWARSIIREYFYVTAIVSNTRIWWIGTATNIEIARHVFAFLCRECRRCLKKNKKQLRSKNARDEFINAFFIALNWKLSQAQKTDNTAALVCLHDKATAEYIAKHYPETTKAKALQRPRKNQTAQYLGWQDGYNTNIRTAIAGKENPELEATP